MRNYNNDIPCKVKTTVWYEDLHFCQYLRCYLSVCNASSTSRLCWWLLISILAFLRSPSHSFSLIHLFPISLIGVSPIYDFLPFYRVFQAYIGQSLFFSLSSVRLYGAIHSCRNRKPRTFALSIGLFRTTYHTNWLMLAKVRMLLNPGEIMWRELESHISQGQPTHSNTASIYRIALQVTPL